MKKLLVVLLCGVLALTGCGGSKDDTAKNKLDLTKLTSTMVYSEVLNMMQNPDSYLGTEVKMQGVVASVKDETDGKTYHTCVIQDATACCQQGIEFKLAKDKYPSDGTEIKVKGVFSKYKIGKQVFYTLKNAKIC